MEITKTNMIFYMNTLHPQVLAILKTVEAEMNSHNEEEPCCGVVLGDLLTS
jgi:hypothetical protein